MHSILLPSLLALAPFAAFARAQDPLPQAPVGYTAPKLELQSARQASAFLHARLVEFAIERGDVWLAGAYELPGKAKELPATFEVHEVAASFRPKRKPDDVALVQMKIDLEVTAKGGAVQATRLFEDFKKSLAASKQVREIGQAKSEETREGGAVRWRSLKMMFDVSTARIRREPVAEEAVTTFLRMCAVDDKAALGAIEITPKSKALARGVTLQSYRVASRDKRAAFDLERLRAFARAVETQSRDLFITDWRLKPVVGEDGERVGWGLDLTVGRIERD
ncbi:MAG: hypothetical protein GY711_17085 [bacterium]|nr:hypothetical protein [bacterium]